MDYELITSYQVFITATDGGTPQLTGSSTITINIVDENDNNPMFSASTYRQSIGENSQEGSVIEILQATDADSTSNAELVFSLLEGTDVFEVDNSSGIVTVLNSILLDYEVQRSFSLLVEVRDMGVPPRAAQALVSLCCALSGELPAFVHSLLYNYQALIHNVVGTNIMFYANSPLPAGGHPDR